MVDRRAVGVLFDGSVAGLLCVVYGYYYDRLLPVEICEEDAYQRSIGMEYVHIQTDAEKADKVLAAVRGKLTGEAVDNIFAALLHEDAGRFMAVFQYIAAGFHYGRTLDSYEHLDYVLAVHKYAKRVHGEAHLLKGFVRFTKTRDGIYYADISPNCDVLQILAVHFAERLGGERWIIHDVKRKQAAVYNTQEWEIMEAPALAADLQTEDGDGYGALWSAFYDAVMIQERRNPKQRRQMMPKYFWKHMTEHKAVLDRYSESLTDAGGTGLAWIESVKE